MIHMTIENEMTEAQPQLAATKPALKAITPMANVAVR